VSKADAAHPSASEASPTASILVPGETVFVARNPAAHGSHDVLESTRKGGVCSPGGDSGVLSGLALGARSRRWPYRVATCLGVVGVQVADVAHGTPMLSPRPSSRSSRALQGSNAPIDTAHRLVRQEPLVDSGLRQTGACAWREPNPLSATRGYCQWLTDPDGGRIPGQASTGGTSRRSAPWPIAPVPKLRRFGKSCIQVARSQPNSVALSPARS
jgi:hypothetical protein